MKHRGTGAYPPAPMTRTEVVAMLDACGRGWTGTRRRAHLALLYRTGLRVAESCSIRLEDVALEENRGRLRVMRPKGVRRGVPPREVGLDEPTAKLLREWLAVRGRHGAIEPWLFVTQAGKAIHPSQIRQTLRMLAKRAGLTRRVHPHALRHTYARELYFEGAGLAEIMVALGHRKLATTQGYLRSIGATEVVERTQRRVW